ncbi:MAG: T9SS type A sorting domain-containing protein, partial [Mongoliitalea sp.]
GGDDSGEDEGGQDEGSEESTDEEGNSEGESEEEKGKGEDDSQEGEDGQDDGSEEENTTEEGTSEGENDEEKGESGDSSDIENEEGTFEGESSEEKGQGGDDSEEDEGGQDEGSEEEASTEEGTNEEESDEDENTSEGESEEGKGQGGDDSGEDEGGQDEGSEESTDEEGLTGGESEEGKGESEGSSDVDNEEDPFEGESGEEKGESGDSSDIENEEGTSEGESGEEKGLGGDDSGEDEGGQDEGAEESTDEEGTTGGESGEEKGKGEDNSEEDEGGQDEGSEENTTEEGTSEGESGEENDESGDDSQEGKDGQDEGSEEENTLNNPTAAPARANLISPAHQASNLAIPVQISWEATALASRYHVQIATDENFNELVFEQFNVSTHQLAISSLSNGTTYFWRVRAANVIGVGPYSERRSFRTLSTIPLPEQTILGSPADNARGLSTAVRITWEQAAHATNYHLQVARDRDFQQILVDEAGIAGLAWDLKDLQTGVTYFWRVRANNASGFGEYSAIHNFTTLPALPEAPILLKPAVAEVLHHENIRFTWEAVYGAESYQLQVSFNPTFTQSVILTPNNLSSTDFTIGSLEADEVYYWRVRAFNEAGTGAYSEGSSFITSAIPALETPTLVAPRNNSQLDVRNVLLKWNAVAGAANYCIQLSTDPAFERDVETVCAIQGTEYQAQNLKQNQVYYWRVQAMGTSTSAYSESWRFEITNKINENQAATVKVTSYPNPFTDQINLTFTPGFDEAVYITVYNSKGIVLFEQTYASSLEVIRISLSSSLPKGMYRVRIQSRSFTDNIGMIKR